MRKDEREVLERLCDQMSDLMEAFEKMGAMTRSPNSLEPQTKHAEYKEANEQAFNARPVGEAFEKANEERHVFGAAAAVCTTNGKGFSEPGGVSATDLVVDARHGFVPLWAPGVTLNWRFNESSMNYFQNPAAAKRGFRQLLTEAMIGWGDASPIRLSETPDDWDFEIFMMPQDQGGTLARAFFPDSGRHRLLIFPRLFQESHQERVETFQHELGHVFGLRHFFAKLSEGVLPSHIVGNHTPFTIMNYGPNSRLTNTDRSDLKKLYELVWSGQLRHINGTPIRLFHAFHTSGFQIGIPN